MTLSNDQIKNLMAMVGETEADHLDCDGCFEHLAEFAEQSLAGRELPEALKAVETHLQQCPCCKDEYQALMEGLRAIDEKESSEN